MQYMMAFLGFAGLALVFVLVGLFNAASALQMMDAAAELAVAIGALGGAALIVAIATFVAIRKRRA